LKELLHIPLLVLLLKDRFAFSDLRGWRIRASSAEEGKERIRDFFLQNTAGMERFICVVEVIPLGRYYAWLLRVPGARKSTSL